MHGHNTATSGENFGVYGLTASPEGTGVFGRSEEQLGGARELALLGERAGAEERLVGGCLFGLDHPRLQFLRMAKRFLFLPVCQS